MRAASSLSAQNPFTLHLDPVVQFTDDQLFELCARNRELRIEREASGELLIMTPAGGKTSYRNAEIVAQLTGWARQDGTGHAFDSSAGFLLPNGAMRSPDAAWVERSRLRALSSRQQERFLPLSPDFVVELRSPSDALPELDAKMREYIDNGVRLAWLIDPLKRRLHSYRPGAEVEVLSEPAKVAADPELPGFVLELGAVWDPAW